MTPIINNFDQIESLMAFEESDGLFLHVQILRRGKDHPELPCMCRSVFANVKRKDDD